MANNNGKIYNCPHITNEFNTLLDIKDLEVNSCSSCKYSGANLWVCLYYGCLTVGCSEQANDHSTEHFQKYKTHCVHLNITSQRAWCFLCECEVFPQAQRFIRLQNPFVQTIEQQNGQQRNGGNVKPALGLMGLQNLANTCYLNAALQALSNVLPMTHYFISCADIIEQGAQHNKADLARNYYQLIREMWCSNVTQNDYIAPRRILYGMRIAHPMFRGFQQHDTQEFLRCFMDQLHEELKEQTSVHTGKRHDTLCSVSSCSSRSSLTADTDYETCDDSSNSSEDVNVFYETAHVRRAHNTQIQTENGKQVLKVVRSIISDIFDGKLLSSVQCLTCDRISTREETFQDLSLPIPSKHFMHMLHRSRSMSIQSVNSLDSLSTRTQEGWLSWMWNMFRSWLWGPSVTLYDCMASFFSADELKGDNMYSCEKCNKLRTGIKYARILNLPEVLCIHLKRFHHDLSYSCKISKHVQFPLEGFDMRPYLDNNCMSSVTNYDLVSVICHHGSVGSGHYTCMARNPINERWYEYDDHRVTEVSAETVANCQAYVLFYSKRNPQMELIRSEAIDLSAAHPTHMSDMRFYITRDWISRFYTFAEPGPINNWTILCPHGGILPEKMDLCNKIAVPISQALWDYLQRKFGGGPVINIIFECSICLNAAEALSRRQNNELMFFSKYSTMEFTLETDAIYAISFAWLRKWQQFAHGFTKQEPGPITNAEIANNNTGKHTNIPARLRLGSDYAQVNAFVWRFLHNKYGGGPEIILRGGFTAEKERPLWPDGESASFTDAESNEMDGNSDNLDNDENLNLLENNKNETTTTIDDLQQQQQTYIELQEKEEKIQKFKYKYIKYNNRHSNKYNQKPKILMPRCILRKRIKQRTALKKGKRLNGTENLFLGKGTDIIHNLANGSKEQGKTLQ